MYSLIKTACLRPELNRVITLTNFLFGFWCFEPKSYKLHKLDNFNISPLTKGLKEKERRGWEKVMGRARERNGEEEEVTEILS